MASKSRAKSTTTDANVLERIQHLVHEEQDLYRKDALDDQAQIRLEIIRVQLDQCWDLLRQRRALREFGKDPEEAKVRPASVVENYEQ
jgi:hypothetical protein